jgi:lysophospholipase L1-like esterase
LLLDRMEALYRRSRAPGRKLVILTLPEEAKGITYTPPATSAPNTAILNDIYREFASRHPEDVSVLDFARHVCPVPSPCDATRAGIHPRPIDGIHFSPQGSAWAARWLWPQLIALWPTAPAVPAAAASGQG